MDKRGKKCSAHGTFVRPHGPHQGWTLRCFTEAVDRQVASGRMRHVWLVVAIGTCLGQRGIQQCQSLYKVEFVDSLG